ncbi:nuclear transport factor 2 family protein [uncultured Tateyamaria sp.]|uniref:nuclear transport factor 2 family protein n=1 Tax=uncultured Tateyamaria sp. TaxID=455651 RepID=UPI00262FA94A|nr:nuclear transport factor 2 family protein [uncultured Tateyamaria sp.]
MSVDPHQRNKNTARSLWAALDRDPTAALPLLRDVAHWHAPAPIGAQTSGPAVIEALFAPFHAGMSGLTRQTHILMAGASQAYEDGRIDAAHWVGGTGYLSGRAVAPIFGIPATDHDLRIRWADFLRFDEGGRITHAQTIWDFVDWFDQIDLPVLPRPRGAAHVFPAPTGYDGVLTGLQPGDETAATLALGRDLIFGGLNGFDESDLSSMGMARFFHPNIKWYGPGGIGACLSLSEFEVFHQQPWLTAFPDRKVMHLEGLFAEGEMLAASGPMGVVGTHSGPYLGHAATGAPIEVSGLDFWRRQGDQFTENWVFVDMIHLFGQMGVDLFARMQEQAG